MGSEISAPKLYVDSNDVNEVLTGTLTIAEFVALYATEASHASIKPTLIGFIETQMQKYSTEQLLKDYLQCPRVIPKEEKCEFISLVLKAGQCDLSKALTSGLLNHLAVFDVMVSQLTADNFESAIAQIHQARGIALSPEESACVEAQKIRLNLPEIAFQKWFAEQYKLAITQTVPPLNHSKRYGLFEDSAARKHATLDQNQPRHQENHRQKVRP